MSNPLAITSIYDLPPAVQDDVAATRRVFQTIVQSGEPARKHLKALADGSRGRTLGNLYKQFNKWLTDGMNDLALVDRRYFSQLWERAAETALPAEFVEWVGGRMLGNQRKSKPAWRDVVTEWKTWRRTGRRDAGAFPGYDAPPPPSDDADHPAGWSYRNLLAVCKLSKAEKALARIGSVAAKAHLPGMTGTREDARWLEWIYFDDVWHDRKCMVPGYRLPARLLQLGCLDYASGLYLKFGLRPELPRDDGTRERLKRRDMLLLVASLLLEYGYPTDYVMHLVVERATATLTLAEGQFLYDLSGGQIQVGYTSMEGTFVLAWEEAKSGNPQGKGPLESWHNLFHNYQGSLAGQVGKDRDHQPAALLGSDREAEALVRASLLLPIERRQEIQMPYPFVGEAHRQTLALVARINARRDHDMEDFQHTLMWRRKGSEDWNEPAAIERVDACERNATFLEFLPVLESPAERGQRLSAAARVAFIPPAALIRFYEDAHYLAKVAARQAAVRVQAGQKKNLYVFGPNHAAEMLLPDGTEIQLHFDDHDPKFALVTHRGVFVGLWPRQKVRRDDLAGQAVAMQRKQSFLSQTVNSVRGKQQEKLLREQRRMDANLETLASADLVPASTFRDLAAGRQVVTTPVAEGVQAAIDEFRAAAQSERAAAAAEADLLDAAEEALERRNEDSPETPETTNEYHVTDY